jgi:hypothetical protein
MRLDMHVFMTDDSTWCARVGSGPTIFAKTPEQAQAAALMAYRARALFSSLLGREPTDRELRRLRRPVGAKDLRVVWTQ